jgi:putative effector of murein hydrolase
MKLSSLSSDTHSSSGRTTVTAMDFQRDLRAQASLFQAFAINFFSLTIIYLLSEAMIWGLSLGLATANLQFFSSVIAMLAVFSLAVGAQLLFNTTESTYTKWLKAKVDFINANLGLAFPIPIVSLNPAEVLPARDIGLIIGNFIITNAFSWVFTFVLALSMLIMAVQGAAPMVYGGSNTSSPAVSLRSTRRSRVRWPGSRTARDSWPGSFMSTKGGSRAGDIPLQERTYRPETVVMAPTHSTTEWIDVSLDSNDIRPVTPRVPNPEPSEPSRLEILQKNHLLPLSLFCFFAIGVPIAATAGDERILDGCMLWFVWLTSVRAQRGFKASRFLPTRTTLKYVIATLMNPVLFTTLFMTGYIRLKGAIHPRADLIEVLRTFRIGTPLYALLTSLVSGDPLSDNPTNWWGAGDAGLSILEVGILLWGFKLFECRKQLFGKVGLVNAIASTLAAVANVYLCTLSASALGLDAPEALAFAARSTTLALAKPAMLAVGGNLAVNAALVVSNGIVGQIFYPFTLDRLGVEKTLDEGSSTDRSTPTNRPRPRTIWAWLKGTRIGEDSLVTLAAGIAIGINGAAMGVAYLYATKSRAAPHAALSMTVFGTVTVILGTMEPFRGVLVAVANI